MEGFVFNTGAKEPAEAIAAIPAPMADAAATYWAHIRALLTRLMELCALALGLPANFFEASYGEHASCFLKVAHYPPPSADQATQPRYGAHTDYQVLTILRPDLQYVCETGGLEVLIGDAWVRCPHVPDSFVINTGDLLQRWTNGRWVSNTHRVAPAGGVAVPARLSCVFFSGPSPDTIIAPLPTCGAPKHEPVSAAEYLRMKLDSTAIDVDRTDAS